MNAETSLTRRSVSAGDSLLGGENQRIARTLIGAMMAHAGVDLDDSAWAPGSAAARLRGSDRDEIFDDGEVGGIRGEERNPVDVGGSGDDEIHRTSPGLSAALDDRGRQATPFAGDRGVDRERVEGRFDHPEAL